MSRQHSEEKHFICDQCNYSCNEAGYLKIHMLIHSGEKPFSCNQCTSSFKKSANLKRHISTHSGEKQFLCDQCNHSYNRACNLKRKALCMQTLQLHLQAFKQSEDSHVFAHWQRALCLQEVQLLLQTVWSFEEAHGKVPHYLSWRMKGMHRIKRMCFIMITYHSHHLFWHMT